MRRWIWILAPLIVIVGLGAYFGSVIWFAVTAPQPGSADSSIILIHKGEAPIEIARQLQAAGVISDQQQFLWVGRALRQWKQIKAGEYKVSPAMSPIEVLSALTSGVSIAHPVTIREGENLYEIAADLESKKLTTRAGFIALCKDQAFIQSLNLGIPAGEHASLEGYLFPDTYYFNISMDAKDMAYQMAKRFLAVWNTAHAERARELGYTRHQVITLASIVEKETGASKERGLISSVFHNRLKKRMKLQSDPTTIYGMGDRYRGNIRKSDLLSASPYNTYVIPGLPTGPISNPGREAIEAALHPLESNFLYFVSHNDGTSEFSATLDAHNHAVRKFQVDPGARSGKSWRNLKKR